MTACSFQAPDPFASTKRLELRVTDDGSGTVSARSCVVGIGVGCTHDEGMMISVSHARQTIPLEEQLFGTRLASLPAKSLEQPFAFSWTGFDGPMLDSQASVSLPEGFDILEPADGTEIAVDEAVVFRYPAAPSGVEVAYGYDIDCGDHAGAADPTMVLPPGSEQVELHIAKPSSVNCSITVKIARSLAADTASDQLELTGVTQRSRTLHVVR